MPRTMVLTTEYSLDAEEICCERTKDHSKCEREEFIDCFAIYG